MPYESLHNHTTISDGQQTPLELLASAEKMGFGLMAITEHDALPDERTLAELRGYQGPVKWLVGCEISSGLPRELGGGAASMFHILGLFTDPTDEKLLDHSRQALAARVDRMERLVDNLHRLDLQITVDDCLAEAGGESVGRPHIVAALLRHPENLEILEQLRREMQAASEHDEKIGELYRDMMRRHDDGQGAAALPYGLFLADNAFIKDIYVDYAYVADMDTSVGLIRGAGGIALIAHWPTIESKIPADMLGTFLQQKRLDGVELATGFVGPDTTDKTAILRELAERYDAATSIGVDGHRFDDLARFLKVPGLAEETQGQTARLTRRYRPDFTFSNLA